MTRNYETFITPLFNYREISLECLPIDIARECARLQASKMTTRWVSDIVYQRLLKIVDIQL